MNTETLKIEIPKGFEVESFNQSTGEIKFKPKPKPVMERIKTFDDVLNELGITWSEFNKKIEWLDDDTKAYEKIKLIATALNEGWKPDWSNGQWDKYYPWFNMNDSSAASGFSYCGYDYWLSGTFVGSRLCYKSAELAKYAGKQFIDIYREFFILK